MPMVHDKTDWTIFEISRMAIHNGPGIRTMVHIKGCPLHCAWCSTPESQQVGQQLAYLNTKCIGCGSCQHTCPEGAALLGPGTTMLLDWARCTNCLQCTQGCSSGALSVIGQQYFINELVKELVKDRAFFNRSGGGVTFSGGEPLMHVGPGDLELLRQLKQQGISMGFDTTGFVPWENIQAVLPYTDFFLWDIKAISPEVHRQFTGADNELILNNLSKADEKEMKLYIRIPVIPGVNDNNLFFQQLTGLLKSLDHVEQVHLMPLHHLGTSRYQKIGREDPYEHVEPIPRDMLEMRCMEIGRAGFQAKIIG